MRKIRMTVAGVLAGALALAGAGAFVASASASTSPVRVSVKNDNGVITVGSWFNDQPMFGATADTNTGEVCLGFSYQVPQCQTLPLDAIGVSFGPSPITIDTNPNDDGRIGVSTQLPGQPLWSAWYYPASGTLCGGFSYETPFCISLVSP